MLTMSVPRSMHSIAIAPIGNGMLNMIKAMKGSNWGTLDVRVYVIDFLRLSKTKRPSSMPVTILAKLSSKRIMSAACFETSDPEIPIATPN